MTNQIRDDAPEAVPAGRTAAGLPGHGWGGIFAKFSIFSDANSSTNPDGAVENQKARAAREGAQTFGDKDFGPRTWAFGRGLRPHRRLHAGILGRVPSPVASAPVAPRCVGVGSSGEAAGCLRGALAEAGFVARPGSVHRARRRRLAGGQPLLRPIRLHGGGRFRR